MADAELVEVSILETRDSGVASLQVFACHEAGRSGRLGHESPTRLGGVDKA